MPRVITRMEREIVKLLRETGLPYRVESGGRHRKVYLDGTQIATFSEGPGVGQDTKQIAARIRRFSHKKG